MWVTTFLVFSDGRSNAEESDKEHFASITRQLRAWGYNADWKQLERALFSSCVLSPVRYARCCGY